MNKFLKEFYENKIIVVCRDIQEEEIVNVANALYNGGIRFMEVPFNQANPETFETTARMIKAVKDALGDNMHVGAGTVITMEQFEIAKKAGAEIIVSPTLEEDVILATKKAGLISMPGCATPSEMTKAYKLGADLIKLFPSSVIGIKAIKEIRVPLNHISLVCFGGVSKENIEEVLSLGVAGVGMASSILDKQALRDKDYDKITQLAKEITQRV
jgi:2-dehydro-3-deoxyphosphogluconate aldolase/(4S)-4-hydroxy-2-oxoglutarate aldolase